MMNNKLTLNSNPSKGITMTILGSAYGNAKDGWFQHAAISDVPCNYRESTNRGFRFQVTIHKSTADSADVSDRHVVLRTNSRKDAFATYDGVVEAMRYFGQFDGVVSAAISK